MFRVRGCAGPVLMVKSQVAGMLSDMFVYVFMTCRVCGVQGKTEPQSLRQRHFLSGLKSCTAQVHPDRGGN